MTLGQPIKLLLLVGACTSLGLSLSTAQNFFSEDFESYSEGGWSSFLGTSGWTIESDGGGGTGTWQIEKDTTTSGGTGPYLDNTKKDDSGNYLYSETSGDGQPNKSFITSSPTIDLSSANGASLQLYLHRYGDTIGTLNIKLSGDNGATYTTVKTFGGQRLTDQRDWEKVDIDLSDYDGNSEFKFQFDYTSGSSFTGDIAFDDILVLILPPIDMASLNESFDVNAVTPKLATTTINGAHHRLLIDSALDEDGWHAWATNDLAHFDEFNASQTVSEVGVSRGLQDDRLRLGLGVGYTSSDQDAIFGGGNEIDGKFFVAEANYRFTEKIIISPLLYYGEYDVDTVRGYAAGGPPSIGETDAVSYAVRFRVDWKDAFSTEKLSITPRVAYTFIESKADAYTEVGGAAPATFTNQHTRDHEVRAGVDIDCELTDKTELRMILESVTRSDSAGGLEGTSGGVAFNLNQQDQTKTWGRAGGELVHRLNDTASIHASVFGSTEGLDATVSGAVGLHVKF